MIEFDVELVVVKTAARQILEVVRDHTRRRLIGRRQSQRGHHTLGKRRDQVGGNVAVGIDLVRVGIAHRRAELAIALISRRDGGKHQRIAQPPIAFVIHKEKRFVFANRAAEGRAELVLKQDRFARHQLGGALIGFEKACRVKRRVAQVVIRRAVELIRAAAKRRIDHRAARAPVFGAEVVRLDFEFLNCVRRGLHDLIREALIAGAVGVVVHAVNDEVIERTAQSVDIE